MACTMPDMALLQRLLVCVEAVLDLVTSAGAASESGAEHSIELAWLPSQAGAAVPRLKHLRT